MYLICGPFSIFKRGDNTDAISCMIREQSNFFQQSFLQTGHFRESAARCLWDRLGLIEFHFQES